MSDEITINALNIAIRVDDLNPRHARLSIFQGRRGDPSLGKAGELIITADCLQAMCQRLQPSVIYWSADSAAPAWLASSPSRQEVSGLAAPTDTDPTGRADSAAVPEAQELTEAPTESDETIDDFFARVGR